MIVIKKASTMLRPESNKDHSLIVTDRKKYTRIRIIINIYLNTVLIFLLIVITLFYFPPFQL